MKKKILLALTCVSSAFLSMAQPCYGPNTAVNGDMQTYNTASPSSNNTWINNSLNNWNVSHGTPSTNGALSLWMWSYSGYGEGVYMGHTFTAGTEYRLTYRINKATDSNPASEFYVKLTNGLIPTSSTTVPTPSSQQVVSTLDWSNSGAWITVTETFTATSNFSQLWLYPYLAGSPTPNQAACSIDDIIIEERIACPCNTTAAFEYEQAALGSCNYNFTDYSYTGDSITQIIGYSWDFGDGSTSTDPNPTHNFTSTGTFNVCLTVWGANGQECCSDTYCQTVVVADSCDPCSFIAANAGVSTQDQVATGAFEFTATGLANDFPGAMGYFWDFGDGTFGSGEVVDHVYSSTGPFVACLTVYYQDSTSGNCCSHQVCVDVPWVWKVVETDADINLLNVYPNPANETVKISVKGGNVEEMELFNFAGQHVSVENLISKGKKVTQLSVVDLTPGLYVLTVKSDSGKIYSKKLIIQ